MNWEKGGSWKSCNYVTVILFILAYILTIPVRNYDFLTRFIDITQGVPLGAHLILILIGIVILLILFKIMEVITKSFLRNKK